MIFNIGDYIGFTNSPQISIIIDRAVDGQSNTFMYRTRCIIGVFGNPIVVDYEDSMWHILGERTRLLSPLEVELL